MHIDNFPEAWKPYIKSLPPETLKYDDVLQKCLDLDTMRERLFTDKEPVEAWITDNNGNGELSSLHLDDALTTNQSIVFVIHQNTSWSRLHITLPDLQRIMAAHSISPVLLDAIQAFGSKNTGDDDPYYNLYGLEVESNEKGYEVCYLLRTYQRHGRASPRDPWSLRQMAVYHKFNVLENRSCWVLIQPFAQCKPSFLSRSLKGGDEKEPHSLHAIFMSTALATWRWYLNDRRRLLEGYNEKALFSSVSPKSVDYPSAFSDCQKLHRLVTALIIGKEVLNSYKEIINMLQSHDLIADGVVLDAVRVIRARARTASALQQTATSTSQLILNLLDCRKSDVMKSQALALSTIASDANALSRQMNDMTRESRSEMRSTKVLTYVATFYLPVSLIAVSLPLHGFDCCCDASPGLTIYSVVHLFFEPDPDTHQDQ
ncbi:hypothetical protein F4780DRAFT_779130 [Xylariomycetidae sp. FL0641]|nr:hypothetical protein F4780DRAFT_779130 [Xylariomycetidae sp. FL0641]